LHAGNEIELTWLLGWANNHVGLGWTHFSPT